MPSSIAQPRKLAPPSSACITRPFMPEPGRSSSGPIDRRAWAGGFHLERVRDVTPAHALLAKLEHALDENGTVAFVPRTSPGEHASWSGEINTTGRRCTLGVRRAPLPTRGDHAGGALVCAVLAVLSGRRGAARRTRHRSRPHQRVPVGAPVHPAVHRGGPAPPAPPPEIAGVLTRRR